MAGCSFTLALVKLYNYKAIAQNNKYAQTAQTTMANPVSLKPTDR
jgi:hypothetical protein